MKKHVTKKKIRLKDLFQELLASDDLLAPRFRNANLIGKLEAHSLPLGTCRVTRSGNRFLLLGDAAFLVDPFSGEGIGNAMASGEIAADILKPAFLRNDFSAASLASYDLRIEKRFSSEFRTMALMQRLAGSARLFNLVVGKAWKDEILRNLLTSMYTNDEHRKALTRPGFYLKLLVK
jgi:flavin-dependent dehydrogenase